MAEIFAPARVGALELPNRLVRSATWMAQADDDGCVTEELIATMRELAEGGVGLAVTGYSSVQPNGRQVPGQTALWDERHVPGMRRLTDAVHGAGGRVACQLVHVGAQTTPAVIGETPVGPSAVPSEPFPIPRALSTDEIHALVRDFGLAAARAVAAGFDAIQIHAAHGYLVSRFLSPLFNQRRDEYGGSLENRMRFGLEVLAAVKEAAGEVPVLVKLNVDDLLPGSTTRADSLPFARALCEQGADALEVSGGGPFTDRGPSRRAIVQDKDEGYFMDDARALRKEVDRPLIVTGGFRSRRVIAQALDEIDLVGLSRPLIQEPDLPRRWQAGETARAACRSCSGCFSSLRYGDGIECAIEYKRLATEGHIP